MLAKAIQQANVLKMTLLQLWMTHCSSYGIIPEDIPLLWASIRYKSFWNLFLEPRYGSLDNVFHQSGTRAVYGSL